MINKLDALRETLDVINKHFNIIDDECSLDIQENILSAIKRLEVSEMFGIEIKNKNHGTVYSTGGYSHIQHFFDPVRHHISWSDDGRQPEDEWLYVVSFPTGAYIFGDSYPNKTFDEFFEELRSYGPKYSDTANHSLYFDTSNAKYVHEDFNDIYKKYQNLVNDELRERRKEQLKKELEDLEDDKG